MPADKNRNYLNVRPEVWIYLFLVLSTLLIYFRVGTFEFINYDTGKYVYENNLVKAGLTAKGIKWAFTTIYFSNWLPLTWLSHMLDVQLYNLNSGQHHLTNVLLHIVNTILLFVVLRQMTGKLWQCGFVAALFAVHPLHVESVAWVAERKDVLSTFFGFLALWFYTRYGRNPGIVKYVPVLLFFILSLMSKPMLVTLPFLLLLLDYWPLRRLNFGSTDKIDRYSKQGPAKLFLVLEKFPLFLVSAASCVVTYYAQNKWGTIVPLDDYPLTFRVSNALVSYVSYIGKMLWPAKLAIIYPYGQMIPAWQTWTAFCTIISISLLSVKFFRLHPWFPVGWLWFLGTLFPVIGLVQVGAQSMADRYTYVPLIGLFIIIAWGLFNFLARWSYQKLIFIVIAVMVSGLFMGAAWKQIGYWKNGATLFKRAVDVTESNYIAENNLGQALMLSGKVTAAAEHFKASLKINPKFAPAHFNIGLTLAQQDKPAEALQSYAKALAENPNYALAYNFSGKAHYILGNTEQAVSNYRQAITINSAYAEAHNNLADTLFRLEEHEKALASYQQAIAIDPAYTKAYNNLGNFWYHTGHPEKALPNYRKALEIDPKFAEAYNGAGAAMIRMGEPQKAATFFRQAVKIDTDYVAAQNNLKNTLAALDNIKK